MDFKSGSNHVQLSRDSLSEDSMMRNIKTRRRFDLCRKILLRVTAMDPLNPYSSDESPRGPSLVVSPLPMSRAEAELPVKRKLSRSRFIVLHQNLYTLDIARDLLSRKPIIYPRKVLTGESPASGGQTVVYRILKWRKLIIIQWQKIFSSSA
jgi:hypothetical protein